MSLDVLLQLRALAAGRALPRASFRHAHLADAPLVVVGYHLAGEPGAPVALRYGTSPRAWRLVVVGEPRNRDQRFAALAEFAADVAAHVGPYLAHAEDEPVADAPQVVVPNGPTAGWVTDTLGRILRFREDPVLATAGAHLTFLGTRRVIPGSAAVLAATDLLTTHWATGQLAAENANLATLLAWIDPPTGRADPAAAEAEPPAGPVSDPAWDRDDLQPAIGRYHTSDDLTELRGLLTAATQRGWQDTWAAVDLVRLLPEAAHVPKRWESDRWAWTRHVDRVAAGHAHFARRLDQLQSFRFLHEVEKRTVALDRQMALDDPLVLAAQVAAGDATSGEIVDRDLGNRESSATGRAVLRPLLRLRPVVPFDRPVGTELWYAANPKVKAEVRSVDDGVLTLMVVKGALQAGTAAQLLPAPGERAAFTTVGDDTFPDNLPETLPWTHANLE